MRSAYAIIQSVSSEVACGNPYLSYRTEPTASGLQETAHAKAQPTATMLHSAESAKLDLTPA